MTGTCTAKPLALKKKPFPGAAEITQPATAYLLAQMREWEKPLNSTDPTGLDPTTSEGWKNDPTGGLGFGAPGPGGHYEDRYTTVPTSGNTSATIYNGRVWVSNPVPASISTPANSSSDVGASGNPPPASPSQHGWEDVVGKALAGTSALASSSKSTVTKETKGAIDAANKIEKEVQDLQSSAQSATYKNVSNRIWASSEDVLTKSKKAWSTVNYSEGVLAKLTIASKLLTAFSYGMQIADVAAVSKNGVVPAAIRAIRYAIGDAAALGTTALSTETGPLAPLIGGVVGLVIDDRLQAAGF